MSEKQKARLFVTEELEDLIYINELSDSEISQIAQTVLDYRNKWLEELKQKEVLKKALKK